MAIFHPRDVVCTCGAKFTAHLADGINATRSPEAREQILAGQLHRATCPSCGRTMTVEKTFYYTDVSRNTLIQVHPRGERHQWQHASAQLSTAASSFPRMVSDPEGRTLRVVFGMDELREKLIAQDAGIDDRSLELLKALLAYEHPILLRRPRLRLRLEEVTPAYLTFVAAYEHDRKRFRLEFPRVLAENLTQDGTSLTEWNRAAHAISLFDLKEDHWVNMWRWSPQPSALAQLKDYAENIRQGRSTDTESKEFQQMLRKLPRGSHLPAWAKKDLRTLFEFAKSSGNGPLEDALFEIRFGIELEDDWSLNDDTEDIDTLWKLLKDLPDTNVEGNTNITEIVLDEGQGGGLYDPESGDITIGALELASEVALRNVVLHEVGHAVQELRDPVVTAWLGDAFGWRILGSTDAEIDEWVDLMGGWNDLTDDEQAEVRDALRQVLGNGRSWEPGPSPTLPDNHPWNGASFGPRLAYEKSGANWYRNFAAWHRADGKGFFLNYWYATLMVVDEGTLDLIATMPSSYAAMSHYEFFAELYAVFHGGDEAARGAVPPEIISWMETNLGAPEPGAPRPRAEPPKREWEGITRPK